MNIIKYAKSKDFFYPLVSSSSMIPKWYKDMPSYNKNIAIKTQDVLGANMKNCMPFLDSLTSGYFILLPQDVLISRDSDGQVRTTWKETDPGITILFRRPSNEGMITYPTPAGHLDDPYVWNMPINIKLPDGYSALITHPLNRSDLPFMTMSGIVDGDGFIVYAPASLPFFLKRGFVGVIEAGTPIAQIIPFKRESWKSVEDNSIVQEGAKMKNLSKARITGWYKNTYWKRKTFE